MSDLGETLKDEILDYLLSEPDTVKLDIGRLEEIAERIVYIVQERLTFLVE